MLRFDKAIVLGLSLLGSSAMAADAPYRVTPVQVDDEKAVFATVETHDVLPARVRTGGVVASVAVQEGDAVKRGDVLAIVGDPKLVLQKSALDAQIGALQAQLAQAEADYDRARKLVQSGAVSKAQFDAATAAFNVASNGLKARSAERAVIEQQLAEGQVLSPADGRVLKVNQTAGSVVMTGEAVATVAQRDLKLRLRIPERHARFMKVGDPVRLDGEDLGQPAVTKGNITLIYPQIQDGQVIADAHVDGLGDYFIGQRVRVWISAGSRQTILVPANLIATRFGLDYARLRKADGALIDIPVQRGRGLPGGEGQSVEILSGLNAGDALVPP